MQSIQSVIQLDKHLKLQKQIEKLGLNIFSRDFPIYEDHDFLDDDPFLRKHRLATHRKEIQKARPVLKLVH